MRYELSRKTTYKRYASLGLKLQTDEIVFVKLSNEGNLQRMR